MSLTGVSKKSARVSWNLTVSAKGRGFVASIRHKLRAARSFGKRHLHLGDNLGMILAAEKGRSGAYPMLQVCRRLAALVLCSDSQVCYRWVPSEGTLRPMLKGQEAGIAKKRKRSKNGSTVEDLSLANQEVAILLPPQAFQNFPGLGPPNRGNKAMSRTSPSGGENRIERVTKRQSFLQNRVDCPRFEGQTILEQEAVTLAVAKDYKKRFEEFTSYARRQKMSLRGPKKLVEALVSFLNNAFELGYDLSEASKFFAAVLDAQPGYGPKVTSPAPEGV